MKDLTKSELLELKGGGVGIGLLVAAAIVFIIGVIDGYVRPTKCN